MPCPQFVVSAPRLHRAKRNDQPGGALRLMQEAVMKATSKVQQQAAGAALAAKRGEAKVKDLKGASKDMYDTMSEAELEDMASTERSDLPERKDD